MRIRVGHINELTIVKLPPLIAKIRSYIKKREFHQIVMLDFKLFLKSLYDKRLAQMINKASIVLPRGRIMTWAIKFLVSFSIDHPDSKDYDSIVYENETDVDYYEYNENSNELFYEGSNLLLLLFRLFAKGSVSFFLLGGKVKELSLAVKHIKTSFPRLKILGTHSNKQLKRDYTGIIEKLKKVAPNIFILDLKTGKQEKWIYEHKDDLLRSVCIGVYDEIRMYAGKKGLFISLGITIIIDKLFFLFRLIHFIFLIFIFKVFFKKEIQCLE